MHYQTKSAHAAEEREQVHYSASWFKVRCVRLHLHYQSLNEVARKPMRVVSVALHLKCKRKYV
jgi:hypothetical protein